MVRGVHTSEAPTPALQSGGAAGSSRAPDGAASAAVAGAPFVTFAGVQKTCDGETLVVRHLDLEIRRGEFLTLLGPSGSGKTTTLMMLAGFETPTTGSIILDGRQLNRVPPEKRDIGMVFQNYALFPHMTVAENVGFPLRVRGLAKNAIAPRVRDALDMVHLGDFGKRLPSQLSGGQQQRVALARALVFEPKLVLMDEPLGALDKQLREHMQIEIRQLHKRLGLTVVYVTHDQGEALTMSDRVAVFESGTIQQIGSPSDLYERPTNAFVAGFIGENNQMPATISTVSGSTCVAVLADGTRVRATMAADAPASSAVTLSVRPERAKLVRAGARYDTQLNGTVRETMYLGDHVRVNVEAAGIPNFVVKINNPQEWYPLPVGSAISIGWNAEDCRALVS